MMVFEFSAATQNKYCMKQVIEKAQGANVKVNCPEYLNIEAVGKKRNDKLFSYDFWEKKQGVYSRSRFAYIMTVFAIVFAMSASFASFLFIPVKSRRFKRRFLMSSLFSVFLLVFWVPIRAYYNANVKVGLLDNPGLPIGYLASTEIIFLFLLVIFTIVVTAEVFKFEQNTLGLLVTAFPAVIAPFLIKDPNTAAAIFGFQAKLEPQLWVFWGIFIIFLVWFFLVRSSRNET